MKTLPVGDFICKVGETAEENWELVDQAKKQGWFFHLTDYPSPYCILECGRTEPNAHVKLRCAEICVEHSKQRNAGKVRVDVTPCGNVRVDRKDAVGECDYKNDGKVEIVEVQTGKKAAPEGEAGGQQAGHAASASSGRRSAAGDRRGAKGAAAGSDSAAAASTEPVSGAHANVAKSAAGSWAKVTFQDVAVRNALLRDHPTLLIKSGTTVKLQPQVDPKTKVESPMEIFASWGRQAEEKAPVAPVELLRCVEALAADAAASIARAAPSRASGASVAVRKAAVGGCAVVSLCEGRAVRDGVLALAGRELTLTPSGIAVKVQPQVDPKTKEEVPTDIFVAWGRKVEEQTPVSESELCACFEALRARCVETSAAAADDTGAAALEATAEPKVSDADGTAE